MVVKTALTAAIWATLHASAMAQIGTSSEPDLLIALHVTDAVRVLPEVLGEAKLEAESVFRSAGVRVVWTDPVNTRADAVFHVDLRIVSRNLAAATHSIPDEELVGQAQRPLRRIYVFYSPLHAHARTTGSNVARLLAAVMVHEVGHVLLPGFGHSRAGIMRGQWNGRIDYVPAFTADQERMMRTRLARASVASGACSLH
jgi:hypothetical protein